MYPKVKSIQFQMDNIVAPSYLVKIGGVGGGGGGTQSKTLITLNKKIWEYLLVRVPPRRFELFYITSVSPGSSLDIIKTNLFSEIRDAFPISWTHLKG